MSLAKPNRNIKIVRMRDRGFSFGLIGDKFGINKKTAYDIYVREKKARHKRPRIRLALIRKKRTQKVIPR